MRALSWLLLLIAATIAGGGIYDLDARLSEEVPSKSLDLGLDLTPIRRPAVREEIRFANRFDTQAVTGEDSPQGRRASADEGTPGGALSGEGYLNQLRDLRLKGIILSESTAYAVLAYVENRQEKEFKKVFVNEQYKGYTLEQIHPSHIEISTPEQESIKLAIFKPYQD